MGRVGLILLLLVGVGFLFRSYLFPGNIFFGPEQGNDFKIIRDIALSHKFTLIGPKTDIAGVYHGPIFYYLAIIPFLFSHGDPYIIALFFIAIQSFSVLAIYLVSKELTESRRISVLSAILFAVSFGSISYSRWISGQNLTIPLSAFFFYFLLRFLKGDSKSLFLVAVTFGLMGQAEFINFLLASSVGLTVVLYNFKKVWMHSKVVLLASFIIALIFSIGNFFLFDLRHNFLITKSLMGLIGGTSGYFMPLSQSIRSSYSMFVESSMNTLGLPNVLITNVILVSIFGVLLLNFRKKPMYHILLFWLLIPNIVLMIMKHGALEQLYVILVAGLIIGVSIVIDFIWENIHPTIGIFAAVLLISTNVWLWFSYAPTNTRLFFQSTQPKLTYKDQLNAVDYVYAKANGRPFFFQAYTIPYFWQDGWEYIFWQRGTRNKINLPDEKHDELLYVIIQIDRSNPTFQSDWYKQTVSKWGILKDKMTFGEITVEERINEHTHEK